MGQMRVRTRLEHHGSLAKLLGTVTSAPERFTDPEAFHSLSGFSGDHVNRLLKGFIGETAPQLVRRVLLERGAYELLHGSSVHLASIRACYSSPESFTKEFRKSFGSSPSKFRAEPIVSPPPTPVLQIRNSTPWQLPCLSGVHWGCPTISPLVAGAEEFGIRMVTREPMTLHGLLVTGDFSKIPRKWEELRESFDGNIPAASTWITVFHDDGLKTKDRTKMQAHLAVGSAESPPGFVPLTLPGGPYITTRLLHGPDEHARAWTFLNRTWVPKPENRLELPGFDIYTSFPAPWSELEAQIWLGLE